MVCFLNMKDALLLLGRESDQRDSYVVGLVRVISDEIVVS